MRDGRNEEDRSILSFWVSLRTVSVYTRTNLNEACLFTDNRTKKMYSIVFSSRICFLFFPTLQTTDCCVLNISIWVVKYLFYCFRWIQYPRLNHRYLFEEERRSPRFTVSVAKERKSIFCNERIRVFTLSVSLLLFHYLLPNISISPSLLIDLYL